MHIEWDNIFHFSVSPWEIMLRGTIVYWFIFVLMRLGGRRDIGSLGMADLLVIVLIADAAQNAMADDYRAVPDGLVLIATLFFWSVFIDRLGYYSKTAQRWLTPARLCIVRNGALQLRAMRREYMTREELFSELRQQGVADLAEVRYAYMEPDGSISVIRQTKPRTDGGSTTS